MKLCDFTKSLIFSRLVTKRFDNSPPGSTKSEAALRAASVIYGEINYFTKKDQAEIIRDQAEKLLARFDFPPRYPFLQAIIAVFNLILQLLKRHFLNSHCVSISCIATPTSANTASHMVANRPDLRYLDAVVN
jgi:hypothetical protein